MASHQHFARQVILPVAMETPTRNYLDNTADVLTGRPGVLVSEFDKMAANEFVLSHPLCFLVNKFGKCQTKLLKSALVDFYSPEVLSVAKQQLLKDIGTGKIGQQAVSFQHIPAQRQGENRASRDVDDMFTLLTTLDEADNVYLSDLPVYVSDNPDNVPSVRLYKASLVFL